MHGAALAAADARGLAGELGHERAQGCALADRVAVAAVIAGFAGTVVQKNRAELERGKAEARYQQVRDLASRMVTDYNEAVAKLPGSTLPSSVNEVGSPSTTVRAVIATSKPACASAIAVARPMPLLAPVTSAVLVAALTMGPSRATDRELHGTIDVRRGMNGCRGLRPKL